MWNKLFTENSVSVMMTWGVGCLLTSCWAALFSQRQSLSYFYLHLCLLLRHSRVCASLLHLFNSAKEKNNKNKTKNFATLLKFTFQVWSSIKNILPPTLPPVLVRDLSQSPAHWRQGFHHTSLKQIGSKMILNFSNKQTNAPTAPETAAV